jgi:hypothetical protein
VTAPSEYREMEIKIAGPSRYRSFFNSNGKVDVGFMDGCLRRELWLQLLTMTSSKALLLAPMFRYGTEGYVFPE